MYAYVPDSPAYTVGLDIDGIHYTGEQIWDIDVRRWERAVEAVPPDEFIPPGIVQMDRGWFRGSEEIRHTVPYDDWPDTLGAERAIRLQPWPSEDPVPARIHPATRPFANNTVRLSFGTNLFENHQFSFDGYLSAIGFPGFVDLLGISFVVFDRIYRASPADRLISNGRGGLYPEGPIENHNNMLEYGWGKYFLPYHYGFPGFEFADPRRPMLWPQLASQAGPPFVETGYVLDTIPDPRVVYRQGIDMRPPPGRANQFFTRFSTPGARIHGYPEGVSGRGGIYEVRWLRDLAWQLAPVTRIGP